MDTSFLIPLFMASWFVQMGFHEGGHAYAADYFGDDTARLLGKKSFNPLDHIEWNNPMSLIWSIAVPMGTAAMGMIPMGMAWVPVNPNRMKNRERAMAWVSFAGPAANLLTSVVCLVLHVLLSYFPQVNPNTVGGFGGIAGLTWLFDKLFYTVYLTSALYGVFNLIPVPPLDGSSILRYFLPRKGKELLDSIAPYGLLLVMILFWRGPGQHVIDALFSMMNRLWFVGF